MTDTRLVDSSIWIAYIFNAKFIEVIESNDILLLSALSLFEIKKKMMKEKISEKKIKENIDYIKSRSQIIIAVENVIAEKAADISFQEKIPMADAIIYATAVVNNCQLITADNDFRGLQDVILLDIKE